MSKKNFMVTLLFVKNYPHKSRAKNGKENKKITEHIECNLTFGKIDCCITVINAFLHLFSQKTDIKEHSMSTN